MDADFREYEEQARALAEQAEEAGRAAEDSLPIPKALIIGLGGSGVQVISRTRFRVRRTETERRSAKGVQFLGLDSVNVRKQYPPLPKGCDLDAARGEFVNLTDDGFEAYKVIAQRLPRERSLQRWWDERYDPPFGSQEDGMKRVRMLGRLALYMKSQQVSAAIEEAVTRTLRLDEDLVQEGLLDQSAASRLPVYLVCSTCGGTGASAALDVLYKIWEACDNHDRTPEIRAFLLLPGVFEAAVRTTSPDPEAEIAAHKANTYAFFRELDFFTENGDQLYDYVVDSEHARQVNIPPSGLVKQVFAIDRHVGGEGILSNPSDVAEIVADGIYHHTMTAIGKPLTGVRGTNADFVLEQHDNQGKRRIYCGLGVSRAVYAADTVQNHLVFRFIDWILEHGFLALPDDAEALFSSDDAMHALRDELLNAHANLDEALVAEGVTEHLNLAAHLARGVKNANIADRPGRARDTVGQIEEAVPQGRVALRKAAQSQMGSLIDRAEKRIADYVNQASHGIRYSTTALIRIQRALDKLANDLAQQSATEKELAADALTAANEAVDSLTRAAGTFPGLKGRRSTRASEVFGNHIAGWEDAERNAELLAMQAELVRELHRLLGVHVSELEQAADVVKGLADQATKIWASDELVGLDAGPRDTTIFIPDDILPEVEDSTFNVRVFGEVTAKADLQELVTRTLGDWRAQEASGRGFLSLGASGREREAALGSFRRVLHRVAMRHFEHTRQGVLPHNIVEAAEQSIGLPRFKKALKGSLRDLAGNVCWKYDPAKLSLPQGDAPPTVWAVARHPDVAGIIDDAMGLTGGRDQDPRAVDSSDPHRAIVLTVEWGLPAHVLAPVPGWRQQYERHVEWAESDRLVQPVHLDKEWNLNPEVLGDFVPDTLDAADVMLDLARARFFDYLLGQASDDGQDWLEELFHKQTLRRGRPRGPIYLSTVRGKNEYKGVAFKHRGGLFTKGREIALGPDMRSLADSLTNNPRVRNSVWTLEPEIERVIGLDRLIDGIDEYRRRVHAGDIKKAKGDARDALIEEDEALERWQEQLEARARRA